MTTYAFQIAQAQYAWHQLEVSRARTILDRTSAERRGWEHEYLSSRLNRASILLPHVGKPMTVAFASERHFLSSIDGRSSGPWSAFDFATRRMIGTLDELTDHPTAVAISNDGKRAAVASQHPFTFRIWDIERGKPVVEIPRRGDYKVSTIAFSNDGRRIATGSFQSGSVNETVKIWDAKSGTELQTLSDHRSAVSKIAFSANDKWLFIGNHDSTAKMWNIASGHCDFLELGKKRVPNCVAMNRSDDRRLALIGCGEDVVVWRFPNLRSNPLVISTKSGVVDVALNGDGSKAVIGSDDGTVRVWNTENLEEEHRLGLPHVGVVAIDEAGSKVTAFTGGVRGETVGRIWEIAPKEPRKVFLSSSRHQPNAAFGLAFETFALNRDGNEFAMDMGDGWLKLYDIDTGVVRGTIGPIKGRIKRLALSSDGSRVAGIRGELNIWDSSSGRLIHAIPLAVCDACCALSFSKDAKKLLGCFVPNSAHDPSWAWDDVHNKRLRSGKISVWDLASGATKEVREFATCAALTSDGRYCVAGCGYERRDTEIVRSGPPQVKVFDGQTFEIVRTFDGHKAPVQCIAISNNGSLAVSGSEDQTARVWNMLTGELVSTLSGHSAAICSVAISQDGSRVVTGCRDGVVKIWHSQTGQELMTLCQRHNDGVVAIDFCDSDRRIVVSQRQHLLFFDSGEVSKVSIARIP